ncbi:sulfite exporter TauE/SafE family protein [Sutcliffiella horikoshii]|uniref:sulfite exporter TauE/SafE family protein n=1 Tax=Sutcliffiella horikoshii TaxID=79883 RepID=UPI00384CC00F
METPYYYLTVIGFIATFIGTLGGGGGLINLPSMLLLGVPIHTAIASNKFSNTFSSFTSFYTIWKKQQVNLKLGLSIVPFTIIGGGTGALLASFLTEEILLKMALVLLVIATILNISKSKLKKKEHNGTIAPLYYPTYIGIGAFDGLFGPGQATLLMHSFINAGHSFLTSIGLTRLQTFASCFISFLVYFTMGYFDWRVGVALGIGSFFGAQTALKLANRLAFLPWQKILSAFSVFLIIYLFLKILY